MIRSTKIKLKILSIGQTGRNFSCRYKEHTQAIKSDNQTSQKSMFADHILQRNHSYDKIEETMEI
jgi:hypothetical protein